MTKKIEQKLETLKTFITNKGQNGAAIAFSGGVDSTTLAAISHQILGKKAIAIIAQSPTHTPEELQEAQQHAKNIPIDLHIIQTHELKNKKFTQNPENRCYFCKKEILQTLLTFAHQHDFQTVFEGTNQSDLKDHRPGFAAIQETPNTYSPWVAANFTKQEIRQIAKNMGLSVHNKPAHACLASRIPFNQPITEQKLNRIYKAEQAIKQIIPVHQLRVRDHNGLARIEVDASKRNLFFDNGVMDKLRLSLIQLGFNYVTLDLEGYHTGSMLKTLEREKI